MIVLLLGLLLAAAPPHTVTLYDDYVQVGPGRFRTLDIPLPVEPARVICSYEVIRGGSGVRAVLLRREDSERWLRGEAHQVEASTPFARSGAFSFRATDPDHYELVLDNRMEGRGAAEVHLLVRLVYGERSRGAASRADPRKGQILVWVSMLAFAAITLYAGARIKSSLDGRP